MVRKTHSKNRFQVKLKKYTHNILKIQAQSGKKSKMSTMVMTMIDQLDKQKLVKPSGKFRLADFEAAFIEERAREDVSGWNIVWVDFEEYVEILEAYSKKSGIPKWRIMDHLIRLIRDLKIFSADNKGGKRFLDAIEGRGKSKVKKIHYFEAEPVEEIPAVRASPVPALKAVARNRSYPLRSFKPIPIRLELKIENVPVSIRKALHNFYKWTDFNVDDEIIPLLLEIELNRNPLTREVIEKNTTDSFTCNILCERYLYKYNSEFSDKKQVAKDLYNSLGLKWSYPPWMEVMDNLIDFYKLSKNYRKLKEMNFSNKMFFDKYGVDVPDTYRDHEDDVCSISVDLKRLGIAEALDLRIKELLQIEDELEYALTHYEELDVWERKQIEIKIRWEYKNHEYAQLLREKFEAEQSSDHLG